MVLDLLGVALVVVAIAAIPVVMLTVLFGVIDYLSDEEKLEEIRRANREGRPVDFSRSGSTETDDTRSGDVRASPADRSEAIGGRQSRRSSSGPPTTVCSACGAENEAGYDRCWNCLSRL